jgi:hypothetical protein
MFTVRANFICIFKTGDNINYNLKILASLYRCFERADQYEKKLLCKPIILLISSVTEAVLHDFHLRMRANTVEGVVNLGKSILQYVQGKKIDQLETYIASARKHDLFDMPNSDFYEDLNLLRRLRNRVHIQNIERDLEEDEGSVFTEARKIISEKTLEKVMKTMSSKYPRPASVADFVNDFELPWNEHLPA